MAVACDLPSGVASDDGALLSPVRHYDLTVTFGALKPAHRLMPAMAAMGRVVLADIGIEADTRLVRNRRARASAARSPRTQVWPRTGPLPGRARCRARSRWRHRRRPGPAPAMSASARRARSTVFPRRSSRPTRRRSAGRADRLHPRRAGAGRHSAGPDAGADRATADRHRRRRHRPCRRAGAAAAVTTPSSRPHEGEFASCSARLPGSKAERALEAAAAFAVRDRLQGAGHAGRVARRPARLRAAGAGLAGQRRDRRRAGRHDRGDAGAGPWSRLRPPAPPSGCMAAPPSSPGRGMIADDLVAAIPHARDLVSEPIVRIAARGDGVTASGRHIAFAVPGDMLLDDGTRSSQGPGHQLPPCRHFPAMRRMPAAASDRRGLCGLLRLPGRRRARPAWAGDRNPRRRICRRRAAAGGRRCAR